VDKNQNYTHKYMQVWHEKTLRIFNAIWLNTTIKIQTEMKLQQKDYVLKVKRRKFELRMDVFDYNRENLGGYVIQLKMYPDDGTIALYGKWENEFEQKLFDGILERLFVSGCTDGNRDKTIDEY
jgi:hypothetical protein